METGRMLTADEIVNLTWALITFGIITSLWFAWPSIEPWIGRVMSRYFAGTPDENQLASGKNPADVQNNNNDNNDTTLIAMLQNERNQVLLTAKAQALATLVHAKKVGQTEGIKLVFGVSPSSSNKTYLAARDTLQAELARLASLNIETPEQAEARLRAMVAASRKEPEQE